MVLWGDGRKNYCGQWSIQHCLTAVSQRQQVGSKILAVWGYVWGTSVKTMYLLVENQHPIALDKEWTGYYHLQIRYRTSYIGFPIICPDMIIMWTWIQTKVRFASRAEQTGISAGFLFGQILLVRLMKSVSCFQPEHTHSHTQPSSSSSSHSIQGTWLQDTLRITNSMGPQVL